MSLDLSLNAEVDLGGPEPERLEVWWRNITHNVALMWREAGVYEALYKSDGKQAGDIVEAVRAGEMEMSSHPEKYEALNPPNGWGDYEGALEFLCDFRAACDRYPKAVIRVSA